PHAGPQSVVAATALRTRRPGVLATASAHVRRHAGRTALRAHPGGDVGKERSVNARAETRSPLLLTASLLAAAAIAILIQNPLTLLFEPEPSSTTYDPSRMVLLYATLPRLAMAMLCGAALAASGAILQQVLRNPLASPTT